MVVDIRASGFGKACPAHGMFEAGGQFAQRFVDDGSSGINGSGNEEIHARMLDFGFSVEDRVVLLAMHDPFPAPRRKRLGEDIQCGLAWMHAIDQVAGTEATLLNDFNDLVELHELAVLFFAFRPLLQWLRMEYDQLAKGLPPPGTR